MSTKQILAAVLVGLSASMFFTSDVHSYYSMTWCAACQPVAVLYSFLANLWFRGKEIQRPLPPPSDDNSNKVAIVTGANTGIGFEVARTLVVDYGWQVVLACRSKDKAMQAMTQINEGGTTSSGKAVVLDHPLDLSDFGSIGKFSEEVRERYPKVDVLVNNAGRNTSGKSGNLDLMFQSNFLGHFALTRNLMDTLRNGRVVNLSSVMHHFCGNQTMDEEYWRSMAHYSAIPNVGVYSASKLAAILFSQELIRRHTESHNISSIAVNPGGAATDIWRGFPEFVQTAMRYVFLTPQQASTPVVAAAVQNDWEEDAIYVQPYWQQKDTDTLNPIPEMLGPFAGYLAVPPRLHSDGGRSAALALWKVSEELTSS